MGMVVLQGLHGAGLCCLHTPTQVDKC
jgi:hypothetical protein